MGFAKGISFTDELPISGSRQLGSERKLAKIKRNRFYPIKQLAELHF
jgi:hypothetical protein